MLSFMDIANFIAEKDLQYSVIGDSSRNTLLSITREKANDWNSLCVRITVQMFFKIGDRTFLKEVCCWEHIKEEEDVENIKAAVVSVHEELDDFVRNQ